MKFFWTFILVLSLIAYHLLQPATVLAAVDILPYFTGDGSSGNNMTSGEYFQTINNGNGTFTINKSRDPGYYEQFKYDNNFIYHVMDTTWATEDGNVTCSNGDSAILAYSGDAKWAPRVMEVGKSYSSSITVQGVDATTGQACSTPWNGTTERSVELEYQGCIAFPNGTVSNNAIEFHITGGPGSGEQFFYDASKGWVGFNRGVDESGAYTTDQIGTAQAGCKQITIKPGAKRCPAGYTCPATPPISVNGETIKFSRDVSSAHDLNGRTGPDENKLQTPDLSQENSFYSTLEFFQRVLPPNALEKLKLDSKDLKGRIEHPGCGNISVGGKDGGPSSFENNTSNYDTSADYDNLLVLGRFWQSIFVPAKQTTLKVTATQPTYPDAPTHTDCANDTGAAIDQATTQAEQAADTHVFGGILDFLNSLIGSVINSLKCTATFGQVCKVKVELAIQQRKDTPGEVTFDQQTVGDVGYIGFFKPASLDYPADKTQRDEDEKTKYQVLGEQRQVGSDNQVGVTHEGIASFQTGTCQMENSLYPSNYQFCDKVLGTGTDGGNSNPPPSTLPGNGSIAYIIDFHNTNVKFSSAKTTQIISEVEGYWPKSLIADHFNEVVDKAVANGINPAFALAVWVEESGASAYGNHFSCPPTDSNFDSNFSCFIGTTNKFNDFAGWAENYCGKSKPGYAICTINEAGHDNSNFLKNLKYWYDKIAS